MKRTQLYLDNDLWALLHNLSRQRGTTVSELVRSAVREKYSQDREARGEAMKAAVGLWAKREDIGDSTGYVRNLRKSRPLERIGR